MVKNHYDQHHARCMERDAPGHHTTQLDINAWLSGLMPRGIIVHTPIIMLTIWIFNPYGQTLMSHRVYILQYQKKNNAITYLEV